jgi:hypothetical protein
VGVHNVHFMQVQYQNGNSISREQFDATAVACVAMLSFLIGTMLMATVWFVHVKFGAFSLDTFSFLYVLS